MPNQATLQSPDGKSKTIVDVGSAQASQLQSKGWVLGAPSNAVILTLDDALKSVNAPITPPVVPVPVVEPTATPTAPPVAPPVPPATPPPATPPPAPVKPAQPPTAPPATQQATLTSPDGKSKTVVNVGSSEASQLQTRGWKLDATGQNVIPVQDALNVAPPTEPPTEEITPPTDEEFNLEDFGGADLSDTTTDPVNQSILEKYGLTAPKVSDNPVTSFADTYKQLLTTMGLPDVKAEFEKTQKRFTDLQVELNDKIAEVNDDPWITEGIRVSRIRNLQDKYEGRLQILTDQQKLYQAMYEQGVQEAQFVANAAFNQQKFDAEQSFNMAQLALKEQEARASLKSTNLRDQLAIAAELRQQAADKDASAEKRIENSRLSLKLIADMFGPDVINGMSATEKRKWEEATDIPAGSLNHIAIDDTKLDTSTVEVGGRKLLINNQTGETIRDLGAADIEGVGGRIVTINGANYIQNPDGTFSAPTLPTVPVSQEKLNAATGKINLIDSLLTSKGLAGSVGAYGITRFTPFIADKADRQDFFAGVQQLIGKETLDTLIGIKAQGGTLGALSDTELNILKESASKINTWMKKDKKGQPTGKFEISEEMFKAELNKMKKSAQKIIDYARQESGDISAEEMQSLRQMNPGMSDDEIRRTLGFNSGMGGTPTAQNIKLGSRLAKVNNNPGNLRYVGQAGATQGDGGFARFSTPEAGYQALKDQIRLDASRGLTLQAFINKYAPPSENDTDLYLRQMVSATGVSPKTPIKNINLDTLAKAMAKKESSTIIT